MKLSDKQNEVMETDGHLLVTGGPGSGKTTISILKASKVLNNFRPEQKVLFLSFARATISRVVEAIEEEESIELNKKERINVDTYHSFFWKIIKSYGHLVGLPYNLQILPPSAEAIALSEVRSKFSKKNLTDEEKNDRDQMVQEEKERIALEEGKICFDIFASYVIQILRSRRIIQLISNLYPVIILDEFQDTDNNQWSIVKALGLECNLIALADPEQRIYDFIEGTDDKRLDQFCEKFESKSINFSTTNYRSSGTDIASFGASLLRGSININNFNDVKVCGYQPPLDSGMQELEKIIRSESENLSEQNITNWSLAILVPTKKMTRLVSDHFRQSSIEHTAAIDVEGAILSAEIIAHLLQYNDDSKHFENFIELLCAYFRGKGGSSPSQTSIDTANNIKDSYNKSIALRSSGKEPRKNSIIVKIENDYNSILSLNFTGDPDQDWSEVRNTLENGVCKYSKEIANEVRNIRILGSGTHLRQLLSQDWLDNGKYSNSFSIVKNFYIQDYFSIQPKPESGIVVMNMHKAKGKQFDAVVIFEGCPIGYRSKIFSNSDRIVRRNSKNEINDSVRRNMMVSITRGKQKVVILTPQNNPCVLLC